MFRKFFFKFKESYSPMLYIVILIGIFFFYFHEFFSMSSSISVDEEFYVSYGLVLFIVYINLLILFKMNNVINNLLLDNFIVNIASILNIYRGLNYFYYKLCSYKYLYKQLLFLFRNVQSRTVEVYSYQETVLHLLVSESTGELVKNFFVLFLRKFTECMLWFFLSLGARVAYCYKVIRVMEFYLAAQETLEAVLSMNHKFFRVFIRKINL